MEMPNILEIGKGKGNGSTATAKSKGKGKAKGKGKGDENESPSMLSWPYADYPEGAPEGYRPYTLVESWNVSAEVKVLRFALPEGVTMHYFGAPSTLKAMANIKGYTPNKSYCAVTKPTDKDHVELLVKRYEPAEGGGLSDFLTSMRPGDAVDMMVKPPRKLGREPYVANNFKEIVMIGAGTAVAPLIQLGEYIFDNPDDHTKIHFIVGHRSEKDILLQERIDALVAARPQQFSAVVALSRPANTQAWTSAGGYVGRIDGALLKQQMPPPAKGVLVMVAGADEFLEAICGDKREYTDPSTGYTKTIWGPVTGHLGALGYDNDDLALVAKL